ncbi:MAG TPA: isoprenylcysteine carboxylmethyltransferase family protein [Caulobacteraceae bacterium]
MFGYIALWLAFTSLFLFVPAGDWRWPSGWAFMAEFSIASYAATLWLAAADPELLAERMKPPIQRDQKPWDRLFMLAAMIVFYGWMAFMALDARRFAWSHMPVALHSLGAVLVPLGFLMVCRVFKENSFAAPVVKIQQDRGQRVISTGPYGLVRHPMYASAIVYLIGMPLLLGSWWGLAVLPFLIAGLSVRVIGEERALREGLEAYGDYAKRVRYRLLPHVW